MHQNTSATLAICELLAEMSGFDYYSVKENVSGDDLSEQIEKEHNYRRYPKSTF